MKVFITLVLSAMLAVAAKAQFAQVRFHPVRLQGAAPYAPAGSRPAGQEFKLPERQGKYLPPTSTTENETTMTPTTETPTTTEKVANKSSEIKEEKGEVAESEEFEEQGVYYIYHPNGLLQKVEYSTKNDVLNMGYTERLTYRDVQPIKDPIFTYDPETLEITQIQF